MRICVITETLSRRLDEGIKNFAFKLIINLTPEHELLGIHKWGESLEHPSIRKIPAHKFFLGLKLKETIRMFNPAIICYIPETSASLSAFIKAKILKSYGGGKPIILIALQPRTYSFLSRTVMKLFIPDSILVQSEETLQNLSGLRCEVRLIPSGVDLEKFVPVDNSAKLILRRKYGIDRDKFVILHVGHINRNRNIQLLKRVAAATDNQVVLVGSTSTPQDNALIKELQSRGAIVITHYLKKIEEVYQLADCYLFQVESSSASIGMPLSVLEAMACNLPVLCTRFGALPVFLPKRDGLMYVNGEDEILSKLKEARQLKNLDLRMIAGLYSWKRVAEILVESIGKVDVSK